MAPIFFPTVLEFRSQIREAAHVSLKQIMGKCVGTQIRTGKMNMLLLPAVCSSDEAAEDNTRSLDQLNSDDHN